MNVLIFGAASAFWLGIMTSISPCPLATNIAAISYIGKNMDHTYQVLISGIIYTLGRTVTYFVLGIFITAGLLSVPGAANFLQQYMNKILGPVLIVVGMVLLGLINLNITGLVITEKMQKKVEKSGFWGAGLLGIAFALSFCPVSAALFFGSLIPLSLKHHSIFILPFLYGIGTGLPVVVFAILIAMGTRYVAKVFDKIMRIELWSRRITGVVFILVGIYCSLRYIFELQLM